MISSKQPYLFGALTALNLVCFGGVAILTLSGFSGSGKATFTEIDAERINIVGSDRKPRIVLANRDRIPGPSMNGKSYPREVADGRQYMSGMIFFNDEGDEVGGLIFNGFRKDIGGYSAVGHLSFDQWKQNQVVALQYVDSGKSRRAGLIINDRPTDTTLDTDLDLVEKRRTASPDEQKELSRQLSQRQANGSQGVQRLFIGSQDRSAQIQLRDTKGKVRVRLIVDDKDSARLEFLDGSGKIEATYPPEPAERN